ncbi:MAG TPA: DUF1150 family protein [Rhizomicrobium sp.]|nr:DUF1150 family protein [Rhizomicrobium sp.]
MTGNNETLDNGSAPVRIAYIKPTPVAEARRLGIVPEGVKIPDGVKLYVLHAVDGTVLGFTDAYESAYGAAVQNELTPVSVH